MGAAFTRIIGKKHPYLASVPPIIANSVTVPLVLKYVYMLDGTLWFFVLTVFLGEVISCGVLGTLLLKGIKKYDVAFLKK